MKQRFTYTPEMGAPVKPRLQEIKNSRTGDELFAEAGPETPEGMKREIYGISAFLMEYYHAEARELLTERPEAAVMAWQKKLKRKSVQRANGVVREETHHLEETRDVLKPGEGGIIVDQTALDEISEEAFQDLITHERGIANVYQRLFQEAMPTGSHGMPNKEDAAYHRLAHILVTSRFRSESGERTGINENKPHAPESFIMRGANTASRQAWWLMLSLVTQYNQNYKQPLTKEELHALAVDAKKILIKIASLHITDFSDLHDMRLMMSGEKLHPNTWEPLIKLRGEPGSVRASVNEEVMEEFRERLRTYPYEELRHGCPAIIAEGERGNIIADIVNLYEQLAEEVLLPRQERIMKLTPKI